LAGARARWLGLALWAILASCGQSAWTGGIYAYLAWSPRGVRVLEVPSTGPGRDVPLRPDDRLLAIDGQPVAGMTQAEVHKRLRGEVGSWVRLTVLRGEETLEMRVQRVPYRPRK
jgi:C-terminal processing protease CtpA/Prc